MAESFFTREDRADGDWFVPTDLARGPWDPQSCHAGPPAGLIARALEHAVPHQQLVRLSIELVRPIPMAGFTITTTVLRAGRTATTARAELIDAAGTVRAYASATHLAPAAEPPGRTGSVTELGARPELPTLAESSPGPFPFTEIPHGRSGFIDAVEVRYPPEDGPAPGPTTVWMRCIELLADESTSPFSRICPLADCGNAFSRQSEPWQVSFVNADLTVHLHREPVGEWLGSQSVSSWQPSGVAIADALLFDEQGAVGRAVQSIVLRGVSTPRVSR